MDTEEKKYKVISRGNYELEIFVKGRNGRGNFPATDSTAIYCITISDDGQKKYDWTYEQHKSSVDSCLEAFVKGLS